MNINVCALEAQEQENVMKQIHEYGWLQTPGASNWWVSPNIKGPLERSILALAATANLLSIGVSFVS